MPEGLRDWERGGLLEAIAYYRSKLEAVVFMWVPAHVGIACNAYAEADRRGDVRDTRIPTQNGERERRAVETVLNTVRLQTRAAAD